MDSSAAVVMVVEDDATVRNLLCHTMRSAGYDVVSASSSAEALRFSLSRRPDVALLDVRLGDGLDGFELARRLRVVPDVRIAFVTAATEPDEIRAGFAAGADLYIEKPFSVERLLARVDGLVRRQLVGRSRKWTAADVVVDEEAHVATRAGQVLDLQPREFDLLRAFAQRPRKVITKAELLSEVWGCDGFDGNVVEQRVSALRRKLEEHGPRILHTVWGVGYTLRA